MTAESRNFFVIILGCVLGASFGLIMIISTVVVGFIIKSKIKGIIPAWLIMV